MQYFMEAVYFVYTAYKFHFEIVAVATEQKMHDTDKKICIAA